MAAPMARLGLKSGLDIFCIVPAYKVMHAQNMKCLVSKYNLTFTKQTRTVFMTVLPNNREINRQKQSENSEFDSLKFMYSSHSQVHKPSRNLKMITKVSDMVKYEKLNR